ncbi:MAG: HDIG domain-containing protein, partial [Candidatus Wallbacteria bacterium]|nr:HDIG domain-containing protein [Candidatus Wallbacteria bacterium]
MRLSKLSVSSPQKLFRILLLAVVFVVFYLLLLLDLKPVHVLPGQGEVADFDIIAPSDFVVEDKKETERFRQEEMERVKSQYRKDPTVELRTDHALNEIFDCIYQKRVEDLKKKYQLSISQFNEFIVMSHKELLQHKTRIFEFLQKSLKEGIREDSRFSDWTAALPEDFRSSQDTMIVIERVYEPNLIFDRKKTEQLKKEASEKVLPVSILINKGDVIVRKGDTVDTQDFKILKEMGLYRSRTGTLFQRTGILIFLIILLFTGFLYIHLLEKDVLIGGNVAWMLLSVTMLMMLAAKMFKWLTGNNITMENLLGDINVLSPAAFPLAVASVVITVLVGGRLAVLISVFLSTFAVYQLEASYYYVYYFLFSSFFSVFMSMKANRTTELSRNGIFTGLINVVVLFSLYLIFEDPIYYEEQYWAMLGRDMVLGFLNGIVSVALAIGFLPYFESVFKISSALRLLEFADLNQPLLKDLMLEAPGTYQHSIVVGNLAQAAAQALGADPLLCKIGGYYHDIGKLKRPNLFMENQLSSENRHDDLSPNLSALIIASHVKDGIETARAQKLPEELIEIIGQ